MTRNNVSLLLFVLIENNQISCSQSSSAIHASAKQSNPVDQPLEPLPEGRQHQDQSELQNQTRTNLDDNNMMHAGGRGGAMRRISSSSRSISDVSESEPSTPANASNVHRRSLSGGRSHPAPKETFQTLNGTSIVHVDHRSTKLDNSKIHPNRRGSGHRHANSYTHVLSRSRRHIAQLERLNRWCLNLGIVSTTAFAAVGACLYSRL